MSRSWVESPAKLNLFLRVEQSDHRGLHPIYTRFQTVTWFDTLEVDTAEEDQLEVSGAALPDGEDNLVLQAVAALRRRVGRNRPRLAFRLTKRIAVAAGLGGGSSDAAAALALAAAEMGVGHEVMEEVGAEVGADVPFLLRGGSAYGSGYGERITPVARAVDDYALAIAVPPFELATGAVYQRWDRLDRPQGPELAGRQVPPSLRADAPLVNDLYPAAVALRPELADWVAELSDRWGRPVAMSGSGPALFAFFADEGESAEAVEIVPAQARAAAAAVPYSQGAAAVRR